MTKEGRLFRLLFGFLLCLVGLFLLLPTAHADNCRRVGVSYSTGYTPTYAPTYQYQAQFAYQYETLVPFVQKVAVNPDFYFSVGDEYRQLAFAKLIAQEYAKLTPPQAPPLLMQPPPQGIQAPPAKENVVVQTPAIAPGVECKPVTTGLPEGFKKLVETKCATCHASGKGKAYLDLSNLDALFSFPMATRDRMFRSVSNGRMPKGGKVEDKELDLFNAYAALAEQAVYGTPKTMEPAKK